MKVNEVSRFIVNSQEMFVFADTAMHAALRSLGAGEKVISVISDIVNNTMKVQLDNSTAYLF